MRLKDADVLIRELNDPKGLIMLDGRAALVSNEWGCLMRHKDVLAAVESAPTIDAVPVVHARWIKSNKHIWRKTATGKIDHFAVDFEYHNGPECEICGLRFCEHCHPEKFDEENCKDQYFCSACGRMEMKEEPYCHCGAKMDGGTEG